MGQERKTAVQENRGGRIAMEMTLKYSPLQHTCYLNPQTSTSDELHECAVASDDLLKGGRGANIQCAIHEARVLVLLQEPKSREPDETWMLSSRG